ncbi:hypothetical protein OG21DRAFT_1605966 [Imleria badia]|nr:hypothetical protein OG21DRAFT_1605966 [Imleria badia]
MDGSDHHVVSGYLSVPSGALDGQSCRHPIHERERAIRGERLHVYVECEEEGQRESMEDVWEERSIRPGVRSGAATSEELSAACESKTSIYYVCSGCGSFHEQELGWLGRGAADFERTIAGKPPEA